MATPSDSDSAGKQQIGPYRLLDVLGEGGMGIVYLAQQSEPVSRRVALKVIKLGMDSKQVLARFELERQALAVMNHDNIARVYEAGTTDRGQPYFVMEHVEGVPITDYADKHRLSVGERIALFQQTCAGVQHAHQKGIIHRDLKPSNILVTRRDEQAVPKIIDFGLARATGYQLTGHSLLTEQGQVVGTPEYMSPEQADLDAQGVDTRTDVYSLGVVLYELLVGELPFSRAALRTAGLRELQRVIREDQPQRPSTRITEARDTGSAQAQSRRTDPHGLVKEVRGDLDWIVLKAMAKEPERRYESANGLAMDLRRHLEHEPVLAGPPGASYRLRKFARKHRAQVVAAALVLLTLVAGVIGTTWFALEARAQAEIAEQNTAEVLRLSDRKKLDEMIAMADELWPAHPSRIQPMEGWLSDARDLVAGLEEHRLALAAIREHASGRRDVAADPWRHERVGELEHKRGRLRFLERILAVREGREPEPPAVDVSALPEGMDLNQVAWPLVMPTRRHFGQEAKGLVLARHTLETLGPMDKSGSTRTSALDTLAWALHANGQWQEALATADAAIAHALSLDAADFAERDVFLAFVAGLKDEIAVASTAAAAERARTEAAELQEAIAYLEAETKPTAEYRFSDDVELQWRHDVLAELVADLERFDDPDPALGTIADVERRLEFAREVAARSLEQPAAAWRRAIASIADRAECPAYDGLEITPQLGLVPIGSGPDPRTGLWEFSHLQSGDVVARGDDGVLALTETTGLVLVLIPGGSFRMGDTGKPHPDGGLVHWRWRPVHRVELDPFFLSKYEMTQGQWARVTDREPSTFVLGRTFGGAQPSCLNPVESISWYEADTALRQLDLALPTEAQWEYAARAGTTSAWWTGDDASKVAEAGEVANPWRRQLRTLPGRLVDVWIEGKLSTAHLPVGSFPANRFGLHDTIGNVWEWCRDRYGQYANPIAPGDGERVGDVGEARRVTRGGSFVDPVDHARSEVRHPIAPDLADNTFGVRPSKPLVR